jgi:hypothetical protein
VSRRWEASACSWTPAAARGAAGCPSPPRLPWARPCCSPGRRRSRRSSAAPWRRHPWRKVPFLLGSCQGMAPAGRAAPRPTTCSPASFSSS